MMYLPIDKLINANKTRTEVVIQEVQSGQPDSRGNVRNVFRNREVR